MPSNANTGSVGQTAARQDAGAPRCEQPDQTKNPRPVLPKRWGQTRLRRSVLAHQEKRVARRRSWNSGDPVADCYMDVATDSQALRARIRKAARSHASGPPVPGEGREPEQPGQTNKQYDRKRGKRDSAVLRLICARCSDPLSFSRRPHSLC
jgi:hypothetical protein